MEVSSFTRIERLESISWRSRFTAGAYFERDSRLEATTFTIDKKWWVFSGGAKAGAGQGTSQ